MLASLLLHANEVVSRDRLIDELSEDAYRHQVVALAVKAKAAFEGVEKTFHDDFDRREHEEFWEEFDRLLSRAGG